MKTTTISNGVLSTAYAAYIAASKIKVGGRLTIGLARLGANLRSALIVAEEAQNKIAENHAKREEDGSVSQARDESGKPVKGTPIAPENMAAFEADMIEFLEQTVDINHPEIKESDFEKYDIEPWVIEALLPFISVSE